MRFITAAACAALLAGPAFADPSADFAQLIEEYEELRAERDVNRRASQGDLEAAAQWPDRSREAVEDWDAAMAGFHGRLQGIDSEALDSSEQASYAVLDHILGQSVALPGTVTARFPFTNDSGFHTSPSFYAMSARVRTVPEAEAYIARLNALPDSFADQRAWLEEAIEEGWTQPRYIMDGVLDQIRAQIVDDATESELYQPLANLPSTMDEAERERLRAEGLAAINDEVLPAYRDLLEFFETQYVPASRDSIGISEVPGGREFYRALVRSHTTLDLTPEEVHETGVQEVDRIRAEMDEAIAQTGFEGSFEEFVDYLRTDERFYAQTEEELMMRASYLSKLADDQMPAFFNNLPRLPYGVRPVPANIAPNYTTGRYWAGDADTGRAGGYLVNTYRLDQRPLYELPALTLHEAVPGHHHQIAIAQELEDVPEFRRRAGITAFSEGWGLYSEFLGLDMGFYQDPYENFGRLSYEMWRACRLVADTGIHYMGWSREEAESCFLDNSALSPLNVTSEVSRYISWPGQALAYKTGEILIRELRAEGEERLGADFDLAEFHDVLLEDGALPLSALENKMRAWIDERAS
ncbi:DUF885 domain-containing protein [Glycocaulis profundi]|nr:DUF885 domain-containing protein [Glycocaulis profundi]